MWMINILSLVIILYGFVQKGCTERFLGQKVRDTPNLPSYSMHYRFCMLNVDP